MVERLSREEDKRGEPLSNFLAMFSRPNRFSFKNGVPRKVSQTPFFVIRHEFASKSGLECAVVVGKKVSKKATERNRLKRMIVARIKQHLAPEKKLRLVVFAKKGLNEENFEQAVENLEKALSNLE